MNHNPIYAKDFSKETLNALSKKGWRIHSTQLVQVNGSWANTRTLYILAGAQGNTTILSHSDVMEFAGTSKKVEKKDHCVVYRSGTPEDCYWSRTQPMSYTEAVEQQEHLQANGHKALIEKFDRSMSIGLPEGW